MAKSIEYTVSFSPAERTAWGGYTIQISLLTAGKNHAVTASSLTELEAQVRTLAAAYGQTCSPYVRLADRNARKPAGFDKWKRGMHIIEVQPATENV